MFENWGQIIDWLMDIRRITLAVTIALCVIYSWFWRPGWPRNPGKLRVPYAGWIVAAIVAFVVIAFAYLISRDPLAPRS
jgi:hypothetical protein